MTGFMMQLSQLVCDKELRDSAVISEECPEQGAFVAVWVYRDRLFARRAEWVGGGDGCVDVGPRRLHWFASSEQCELLHVCKALFFIQLKQEA